MTTHDIAHDLVALCQAGHFAECGEKYWSEDVISVEAGAAPGVDSTSHGKTAAHAKAEWWVGAHEVHSVEVEGPFVNGDQFIVRFMMDITVKATGEPVHMDETALYTVRDGLIAEERFFYAAPEMSESDLDVAGEAADEDEIEGDGAPEAGESELGESEHEEHEHKVHEAEPEPAHG